MNDLIEKLAGEARLLMFTDDKGNHYVSDGNLQRFAELIVAECNRRANQYISTCGEVASLPEHILEQHFGVADNE